MRLKNEPGIEAMVRTASVNVINRQEHFYCDFILNIPDNNIQSCQDIGSTSSRVVLIVVNVSCSRTQHMPESFTLSSDHRTPTQSQEFIKLISNSLSASNL